MDSTLQFFFTLIKYHWKDISLVVLVGDAVLDDLNKRYWNFRIAAVKRRAEYAEVCAKVGQKI